MSLRELTHRASGLATAVRSARAESGHARMPIVADRVAGLIEASGRCWHAFDRHAADVRAR